MILQFLQQIVRWCLNNKALTLLIYVWLIFRWVQSFRALPLDVLPDLDRPRVTVFTEVEWRAPIEIEQLVTSPLERVLNGAPWVLAVRSSTTIWLSIINIEFDRWSDVYKNRQVISELLQSVELPEWANPILWPTGSLLWEILRVWITSPDGSHDTNELRSIADRTIKQQLMTIPGIAQIIVMWWASQEYQILLDPIKLSNYGLTYSDVLASVEASNVNRWWWFLTDSKQEAPIRIMWRTTELKDIKSVIIGEWTSWPILLSQVADVRFGTDPNLRWDASINGKPWTLLRIIKQPGINTLDISAQIDDKMDLVSDALPVWVELTTELFRQDWFIEEWLDNVTEALRDAIIVIVIIITIFLMNGRLTLMTLLSVPLSILMTFIIFRLLWQGINVMTLWGITIAIWELVDDSIVWVENMRRRLREWKQKWEWWWAKWLLKTIYIAINEVRSPIVYTTFLGVLAFIPFISLPWLDGRMLAPIGIAYITALVCSTIISVSILPVLASYLMPWALAKLKAEKTTLQSAQPGFDASDTIVVTRLKKVTKKGIQFSLRFPKAIFVWMLICIPITYVLYAGAGKAWLPELNEPSLTIWVVTPLWSSLEHMRSVADSASAKILQVEGIKSIAMTMWRAGADAHANGPNVAELEVHTDKSIRSQEEMIIDIQKIADEYDGIANFSVWRPITHRIQELQSWVRAPIVIKVFGPELDILDGVTEQILSLTSNVDGIVNAQMKQEKLVPQVSIELDKPAALSYGVAIWEQVEEIENGLLGIELSDVLDGNARYPLILRFDPSWTNDLNSLNALPLVVWEDQVLSLWALADIKMIQSPNSISHDNLQRRKVISAFVQERDVVSAVEDIKTAVGKLSLPQWYVVSYEWDYASQKAANRSLLLVWLAVLAGIYMVLLTVLKKHRVVMQVLLDVVTAFLWWMIAVKLSGNVVSTAHMVWFVSLLGIVSRNGILLIEHYLNLMKEWMSFDHTLIIKGSLERVVPVLMTVLTSGIALLPLIVWAGAEAGKEILAPIAVVTFWWLIFSSIIEVFLRPWVFYWMNKGSGLLEVDDGVKL